MFFRFVLTSYLTISLVWAQAPAAAAKETLRIYVLEGGQAVNSVQARQAIAPVVEVRDENDRPVEGAEVTFWLPKSGPGGFFERQTLAQTVRTNYQGQATVREYVPNEQTGTFAIQVTARHGGRTGTATVVQTNSSRVLQARAEEKPKRSRWKWVLIGSAVAGGAAAGVALATRDKDPNVTTITLLPGGVGVSGPR